MGEQPLRGQVVLFHPQKQFGFIQPIDPLPPDFSQKQVHFVANNVHDYQQGTILLMKLVRFIPRRNTQARPSAFRVWLDETGIDWTRPPGGHHAMAARRTGAKTTDTVTRGRTDAYGPPMKQRARSLSRRGHFGGERLTPFAIPLNDDVSPTTRVNRRDTHEVNMEVEEGTSRDGSSKHQNLQQQGLTRTKPNRDRSESNLSNTSDTTKPEPMETDDGDTTDDPTRHALRADQFRGTICAIKGGGCGFIRTWYQLPPDYNQKKDIFFHTNTVSSGLLRLCRDDVLEFQLGTKDKEKPFARNVKLTSPSSRGREQVQAYMGAICLLLKQDPKIEFDRHTIELLNEILELRDVPSVTQVMNSILTCLPVWTAIGKCPLLGDEGINILLELLQLIEQNLDNLHENFVMVIDEIMKSDLMKTTQFNLFVQSMKASHDHEVTQKVQEFALLVNQHTPHNSRILIKVLRSLLQNDDCRICRLQFKLLQAAARQTTIAIQDMEWYEIPLVPTTEELLKNTAEQRRQLNPLKLDVPYDSPEEYIDTYFRLLRADCFEALKKGVQDLLNGQLDEQDMNVYTGVQFAGIVFTHGKSGPAIALKLPKQSSSFHNSSKLMFGNLLCISVMGHFQDPLWATVVNRELMISDGILIIELCSEGNICNVVTAIKSLQLAGPSATMVESPSYYKSFHPVLKSLQKADPKKIPFISELVQCNPTRQPPEFLLQDSTIATNLVFSDYHYHIDVETFCSFPHQETCMLDVSQLNAVQNSLKSRVAIIQGPPGTGKTFVGIKLLEIIMSMSCQPRGPVLVLTYKNHALDEFLKAILGITTAVARIGGRCSVNELRDYNLQQMSDPSQMPRGLRFQLNSMTEHVKQCEDSVRRELKRFMKASEWTMFVLLDKLDEVQKRQFLQICKWENTKWGKEKKMKTEDVDEVQKYIESSNMSMENQKVKELFKAAVDFWIPNKTVYKEAEDDLPNIVHVKSTSLLSAKKSKKETMDTTDFDEIQNERQSGVMDSNPKARKLKDTIISLKTQNTTSDTPRLIPHMKDIATSTSSILLLRTGNLWELNEKQRLLVTQHLLFQQLEKAEVELEEAIKAYQQASLLKVELQDQHRIEILRSKKVIGMTVTGASIYHHYLEQIKPAIVIIEEAAEVLEPQLMAILGDWTQQLILIGDHKQLRPQVETYKLVCDHHFDVSMMERLIKNNITYSSLALQNRMRPEFAKLLLDIYPKLQTNTKRVAKNEAPKCANKSMFFWSHTDPETKTRSCYNEQEAVRVVRLALFFIQQGHSPESISVLAAYRGQAALIRKKLRESLGKYKSIFQLHAHMSTDCNDDEMDQQSRDGGIIKVHTIDMFQGDENDIVIISLVRSNFKGNLGFLKRLNRRCVAQSRARCGMYFVGNASLLRENSNDWVRMIEGMERLACVGEYIPLQCPHHNECIFSARTAQDITLQPFCVKYCREQMSCGRHECQKLCQPFHFHTHCDKYVQIICKSCGLLGKKKCQQRVADTLCKNIIQIVFKACGHKGTKLCHEDIKNLHCKAPCQKSLPCGHKCHLQCWEGCIECVTCKALEKKAAQREVDKKTQQQEAARQQAQQQLKQVEKYGHLQVQREVLHSHGPTASEYFDVQDRVKRYVQASHKWFPEVTKIEKITNLVQEIKWIRGKKDMIEPDRVEMKFHGTSLEGVEGIISEGFRIPTTPGMFGAGIYFASDSSKSARDLYTKGSNMLLLCQVRLGKSKTVVKCCKTITGGKLREEGYDSVFAPRNTHGTGGVYNDEFVVFKPEQAIVRYVIHYISRAYDVSNVASMGSLEAEAIKQNKLMSHEMKPRREVKQNDPLEQHYRRAESQFLRLIHYKGYNNRVVSITYHISPTLLTRFQAKADQFKKKYPKSPEGESILAFHGTKQDNIMNIVRDNFRLDLLAKNTGNKGLYGAGIYFSEFPAVGIGYAGHNQLLLCKVLPGKSYDCPGPMEGAPLQPGFDSHLVNKDSEGRGHELVIYDPAQILPCYVIQHQ